MGGTDGIVVPTATIGDLLQWGPCWEEERIRAVAGGRDRWSAADVLALEGVPIVDRLWVVLRPQLIPEGVLRLWACDCVRHTPLADGRTTWDLLGDERSRSAVEVAERFAAGEATERELAAARDAARAAARDAAARDAAWDAAWVAARAAARAAAARDAAWDAARDAAWAAVWDAARAAQVDRLRVMIANLPAGGEIG